MDKPSFGDGELSAKLNLLGEVFRPSAPMDRKGLFSGRNHQVASIAEAVTGAGQHAVIYGERGVGKTSLAAYSVEIQRARGLPAVRVTLDNGDNFASIWAKVIQEFEVLAEGNGFSGSDELRDAITRASESVVDDEFGPQHARMALRHLTQVSQGVVVFFDEFDQLRDPGTLGLFSNTIKMLSDQIEPVTLVAVGVSESVEGLIFGHQSIARALVQVKMPRMTKEEIRVIVERGLEFLGMTMDEPGLRFTAALPGGMPQYAHLLAGEGARQALLGSRLHVTLDDVMHGLRVGLQKLEQTLSNAYSRATYSPQPNRLADVLLACAIVSPDEEGFFQPKSLRVPYGRLIGEANPVIARFNPQLAALCGEERGEILARTGGVKRWRYRFRDSLMEPYVLLRGLDEGRITPADVTRDSI